MTYAIESDILQTSAAMALDIDDTILSTTSEGPDAPADETTPYTIAPGETFTGTIETNLDQDAIAIEMEQGFNYTITVTGGGTGEISNPYAAMYDSNWNLTDIGLNSGSTESFTVTAAQTGTQYLLVGTDQSGAVTSGDYTVTLTQEVLGGVGSGARIYNGETVSGTIDFTYDDDWYGVELKAGYTYVFELNGDGTATQATNPTLEIYSDTGSLLDSNTDDGIGYNAVLAYTPVNDGLFYINATAAGNSTLGGYELSMDREIADNTDTMETLYLDETIHGQSDYTEDYGDQDWYTVDLKAGYTYVFDMTGDGSTSQIVDPYLSLYDVNGTLVETDDNDGEGNAAMLHFTVSEDGTYYLSAQNQIHNPSAGGYELSMEREQTDMIDTQAGLVAGQTISNELNFTPFNDIGRDYDMYRVELQAGEDYVFHCTGDGSAQSMTHPYVILYDAAGNEIDNNYYGGANDAANMHLDYTAGSTDVYYVLVTTTYNTDLGGYSLTLEGPGSISGTNGADTLNGSDLGELISGGKGHDTINGRQGWDYIKGGKGSDVIDGGNGNDILVGNSGADIISGGNDHDRLVGNAGDDVLIGGGGNDTLKGGSQADDLDGGNGDDILEGNEGADILKGGKGNDILRGNASSDDLRGGQDDDLLEGGAGSDMLAGNDGNDTLRGGDGYDTMDGGDGNDRLSGGRANDILDGGAGDDMLEGGDGADSFIFNGGTDVILDYDVDRDDLVIDTSLGNFVDADDVLNLAVADGPHVIIDFGNDNVLTLEGVGSIDVLADSMSFHLKMDE